MPHQKDRIATEFQSFPRHKGYIDPASTPKPFCDSQFGILISSYLKSKGLLHKVPNKTQVTKLERGKKLARIRISLSSPFTLSQNSFNVRTIVTLSAEFFASYRSRARITLELVSRNNRIASESSGDLSQSIWVKASNSQGTLYFLSSMNSDATGDLRDKCCTPKTSISLFTTPTRLLGPILQLPFRLSLTSNHK
jgi:hypothetical protein